MTLTLRAFRVALLTTLRARKRGGFLNVSWCQIAVVIIIIISSAPATTFGAGTQSEYVGEDAAQFYASFTVSAADFAKQYRGACFLGINEDVPNLVDHLNKSDCLPNPNAKKTAIIWGDSAMAMYASELKAHFARAGYSMGQFTGSLCPPVMGFQPKERPNCKAYNDIFLQQILRIKPSLVVMDWTYYEGYDFAPDAMTSTINLVRKNGIRVVVLRGNPYFDREARLLLADRARKNDPSIVTGVSENKRLQQVIDSETSLKRLLAANAPGVPYVSIFSAICPHQTCILASDGVPLYTDDFHVSPLGSSEFTNRFFSQLLK